jgi:hypothetical protein
MVSIENKILFLNNINQIIIKDEKIKTKTTKFLNYKFELKSLIQETENNFKNIEKEINTIKHQKFEDFKTIFNNEIFNFFQKNFEKKEYKNFEFFNQKENIKTFEVFNKVLLNLNEINDKKYFLNVLFKDNYNLFIINFLNNLIHVEYYNDIYLKFFNLLIYNMTQNKDIQINEIKEIIIKKLIKTFYNEKQEFLNFGNIQFSNNNNEEIKIIDINKFNEINNNNHNFNIFDNLNEYIKSKKLKNLFELIKILAKYNFILQNDSDQNSLFFNNFIFILLNFNLNRKLFISKDILIIKWKILNYLFEFDYLDFVFLFLNKL